MYNHSDMKVNLAPYAGKKICVAVSGGKDSMALLHYVKTHGEEFDITLCAINCDHGIRGEASERDSAFVAAYCGANGIELFSFKAKKGLLRNENDARVWRKLWYDTLLDEGKTDLIATAHHQSDNAETVLFNLARGAGLPGMSGITDVPALALIRPLIGCSREEIDRYIEENKIPFVTDESNLTDDYTRNKIRHNVLPALEEAVPGAAGSIFRFSRLAAEDEDYLNRQAEKFIVRRPAHSSLQIYGYLIKPCRERVIFRHAAMICVASHFWRKDYTAEHFNKLFELQSMENGKKFEFLNLIATKEEGGVAIVPKIEDEFCETPFKDSLASDGVYRFGGAAAHSFEVKRLRFDIDKIPATAVVRFKKAGDKFTKFGGGTKSLSAYLTDKKVPQSMRANLPLVCDGNDVLIVGGVEISDKIKVDEGTLKTGVFICADPFKLC